MSKQDRQKLSILVILLVVLGLTILLGYRMNTPAVTSAVQTSETKTSANPPAATDARIRLDLIEKLEGSGDQIGQKNVFQYRQTAVPSASRPGLADTPPPAPGPVTPPPTANRPPVVAAPGPPPIPLKYQGYAVVSSSTGHLTAFLVDDATRHYNVTIGEVLMGRYRITQVSSSSVEVEDLETSRRQTLPLLK